MVQAKVAVTRMSVVVCVGDPDGWRLWSNFPGKAMISGFCMPRGLV